MFSADFFDTELDVHSKKNYGERSMMYCHEAQQDGVDPRKDPLFPFHQSQFPRFVCVEETDQNLLEQVDSILVNSDERWLVILGRQTKRLRELHRFLLEKIDG